MLMAKQLYAGIDLGGTNIKYGLVDRHAEIIYSNSTPTGSGRQVILKQFAAIASELEQIATQAQVRSVHDRCGKSGHS